MPFASEPSVSAQRAVADAVRKPFWLDDPGRPQPHDPLTDFVDTDLAVVGAGYSGLWTALLAKEQNPERDVVVVEGGRIGWAASGRNGGFCAASLTHGLSNGINRFPDELPQLIRMGEENLNEIEATLKRYNIDAEFERTGEYSIAVDPYQVDEAQEFVEEARRWGEQHISFMDRDEIQAEVHSPLYLGAIKEDSVAMVHPAKLAWGLAQACEKLGVRFFEQSPIIRIERDGPSLRLVGQDGEIRAAKVALATNAFPPLLTRIRQFIVPVYDHAIMTEPLTAEQMDSIGWKGRQGLADGGNQFHYYRLTADNRILYGGYDAIYHWNNGMGPGYDHAPATNALLAQHFLDTFPQLGDISFEYSWGGAIDTSTRFSAFWGKAYDGKLAYVVGFTGLGVGATRFGANTLLDLLDERDTERTQLRMVQQKPLPFPPEPLRSIGINITRKSFNRADHNDGKRNLWLKTMDAVGLGFDS